MVEVAAASAAWLGASLVVLADGRRGLSLGVASIALGLAGLLWQAGGELAAAALVAGGAIASVQRLRSGVEGWIVMPPGSTPRLILCAAAGLVGLWFAASVTIGSGAPLRFAVLTVIGLTGARIVTSRQVSVALTAVGGLALAAAAADGLAPGSLEPAAFLIAAVIAAGSTLVRVPAADAA